jgi:catechol 2,3-dioxygenase-like lactoylglutathione lyase family enzyme
MAVSAVSSAIRSVSVTRLSHVVLRCADLEQSQQFYETIGLQLNPERHGAGSKHYSCSLGAVVLELYPFTGKSTSGLRLGLVVSNLEDILESLKAKKTAVTATDGATATLADPDGHQIVLEQEQPA